MQADGSVPPAHTATLLHTAWQADEMGPVGSPEPVVDDAGEPAVAFASQPEELWEASLPVEVDASTELMSPPAPEPLG